MKMKQADAARKIFRELVNGLDKLPSEVLERGGSEYSFKLVSNLFSRDKKMKAEVAELTSKLTAEQLKIFRKQMSIKLDHMFAEKLTARKRDVRLERKRDMESPEYQAKMQRASEEATRTLDTLLADLARFKEENPDYLPPCLALPSRRRKSTS